MIVQLKCNLPNLHLMHELNLCIQVIMRNLTTEEVSVFTYEEWLSRTHGSKKTMICEMAAVVDEEMMVEVTTYIVQVKTSDIAGMSSTQFCDLRRTVLKFLNIFAIKRGTDAVIYWNMSNIHGNIILMSVKTLQESLQGIVLKAS